MMAMPESLSLKVGETTPVLHIVHALITDLSGTPIQTKQKAEAVP